MRVAQEKSPSTHRAREREQSGRVVAKSSRKDCGARGMAVRAKSTTGPRAGAETRQNRERGECGGVPYACEYLDGAAPERGRGIEWEGVEISPGSQIGLGGLCDAARRVRSVKPRN